MWEPLVSPVSIIALSSLAAGLANAPGARSPRRHSDLVAALLLGISLASFSYGPAFAAAAAVDVLLRPEPGGGSRW